MKSFVKELYSMGNHTKWSEVFVFAIKWGLAVGIPLGLFLGGVSVIMMVALGAGAEIVRVDESQIAYSLHWDTSEETLARGGFNGGPYVEGETFVNNGDHADWQSMSGTLPLRIGIAVEGTKLVIHKDSTRQANECFDWIMGTNPTNKCGRSLDRDADGNRLWNAVSDNRLWITAEGAPTSTVFIANKDVIPRHGFTMYPMVCRPEEEALGFCNRLDPCIFNDPDAGEFGPCEDTTINVHTIAEMRTGWIGGSQQGGGRWSGVVTTVLNQPVSNLCVRFNTSMSDFAFSTPGIHKNLRFTFYDENLNEVGVHVIRADVEAQRWPYKSMFMDAIEACFADTSNANSISMLIVDSVDGQRWALRGLHTDPTYSYDLVDVIPMTPCEPPIAGLQRDWEPDTGTFIRDPSPHTANHIHDHHAASHHAGDHDPSEEICGGMGLSVSEAMTCYCAPDPVSCCEALAGGPICGDRNLDSGEECDDGNNVNGDGCSSNCMIEPPPICELTADLDNDGVVGISDFNIFRRQFGMTCGS